MDVQLRKWGSSLGFRIPSRLVQDFELDETSLIEIEAQDDCLVIRKKNKPLTLDDLLASIPEGFRYPDDVKDFVTSGPVGREMI